MRAPPFVTAWLGYAYGASGDRTRALESLDDLNKKSQHSFAVPLNQAIVYLGIGDLERALDGCEKAYLAHSEMIVFFKMDKIFDPLRKQPRFKALLKKLNFEP